MAVIQTDTFNSITRRFVLPGMPEDTVYNDTPALAWLMGKPKRHADGGTQITQTAFANKTTNVGSYAGSDARDFSVSDPVRDLAVDWTLQRGEVTLFEDQILKNMGNIEQISDLIKVSFEDLDMAFYEELESQIFGDGTGNGGLDLTGLGSFMNATPATGTYAGVSRATNTWIRHKYTDFNATFGAGAITKSDVNKIINDAWGTNQGKGKRKPTHIWCDYPIHEALFDDMNVSNNTVFTESGKGDPLRGPSFGYDSYKIRNIPVLVSQGIAEGSGANSKMYVVNDNFIKLIVHRKRDMELLPWQKLENVEAIYSEKRIMCNIICSNPRFQHFVDTINT